MQPTSAIGILLVTVTLLLALLVACAIAAIYLHNRWRLAQQQHLAGVQSGHQQQLLATRLEVQEQTLQQLMREIHDNIGSSLTMPSWHWPPLTLPSRRPRSNKYKWALAPLAKRWKIYAT
jgi:hypothetical protein